MEDLKEILNLNDKESKIFYTLKKISKGSVNNILKKTQIERRTIYDVLERLIQKGYVTYTINNGKKTYSAINSKIILEGLQQNVQKFRKIIPILDAQEKDYNQIEVLEGKKGIRTIFNEITSSKETHYAFGDVSKFIEQAGFDTENFLARLNEMHAKEKIIYPEGKKILKIKNGDYRILKPDLVPPAPTIIYGDITALFIFSEPVTIIRIKNKDITNSYKKYFDIYWNMSKKIKA